MDYEVDYFDLIFLDMDSLFSIRRKNNSKKESKSDTGNTNLANFQASSAKQYDNIPGVGVEGNF